MRCLVGRIALVLALSATLPACATVSSSMHDSTTNAIGKGLPYYLPKGLVNVRLARTSSGQFVMSVKGPVMVADDTALFYADLRQGVLSDDVMTVSVDPKTGLLTNADVTSTGRAAELIENIAKFAVNLQSGEEAGGTLIFSGLFDLQSLDKAAAQVNGALSNYYNNKCTIFGDLSDKSYTKALQINSIGDQPSKDLLTDELEDCRLMRLAKINSGKLIEIDTGIGEFDTKASLPTVFERQYSDIDKRRCATGLCYRPLRPVVISTRIGGTFQQSETFVFPDTAQLASTSLTAGVFTNQKYKLTFDQGALVTSNHDLKSEVVGFSSLPIKILKAIIAGPAEALGVRKERLTAEQQYLQTVSARSEQISKTNEECTASPQNCPSTALKIMKSATEQKSDRSAEAGSSTSNLPGSTDNAEGNTGGQGGTQPTGG